MAIIFQSKEDTSQTLLIGGQSELGVQEFGLIGPFPRYSISREELAVGDGTYLNTKFTINITGTAVLKNVEDIDTQDITIKGQRQNRVQGEALIAMHFNRKVWPMNGNGALTIESYDGLDNPIIFNDARLTSVELPEQNEDSAGIQNLEYAFIFESYQETSGFSTNTGDPMDEDLSQRDPTYLLESVEETWDVTQNEGQGAFRNHEIQYGDESEGPWKTFTMTHNVSAVGKKKMATGTFEIDDDDPETDDTVAYTDMDYDGEAWRQASKYVATRLINEDPTKIRKQRTNIVNKKEWHAYRGPEQKDTDGNDTNLHGGEFAPANMDRYGGPDNPADSLNRLDDGTASELGLTFGDPNNLLWGLRAYNHIRSWSNDIANGSCSVTETWLISEKNQPVLHDIDISVDLDGDTGVTSVTLNGTIQGLSTGVPGEYMDGETVVKTETFFPLGKTDPTRIDIPPTGNLMDNKYYNARQAMSGVWANCYDAAKHAYYVYPSGTFGPAGACALAPREKSRSMGHNKITGTITWSVSYDDYIPSISGAISDDVNVTFDNHGAMNQHVAIIGVIDNIDPITGDIHGPVIQNMNTTNEIKWSVSVDAVMDLEHRNQRGLKAAMMQANCIADDWRPDSSYRTTNTHTWNPRTGSFNYSTAWVKTGGGPHPTGEGVSGTDSEGRPLPLCPFDPTWAPSMTPPPAAPDTENPRTWMPSLEIGQHAYPPPNTIGPPNP